MVVYEWLLDSYWSWCNCIVYRLHYNNRIDYCSFWEELNSGWYKMQDDWAMSNKDFDPYNLRGRDVYYRLVMDTK